MRILLLEDDYNYKESIKELLLSLDYEVDDFLEGKGALEAILERKYELLLLDIRTPGIDGYGIAKEVRALGLSVPIIFITSLGDEESLSRAYELGCNDFIRKPFSLKELKYRVNEAIRRYHFATISPKIALAKGFSFDIERQILWRGESEILLSEKERKLLYFLVKNLDTFIEVSTLREYVWEGKEVGDNDIRMAVKKIRDKSDVELIQSQRGMGYKVAKES